MCRSPRAVATILLIATVALGTASGSTDARPRQGPAADDPGLSRQWALDRIGAPTAWSIATGAGVTIAIVDSGIDLDHPDLRDKIDGHADCVGHDTVPSGCIDDSGRDEAGHGTHVAGIAAASTGNGQGVAGVAPLARLLSVRVLEADCGPDSAERGCDAHGTESDVARGVRWAADHGADVINLSLGSVAQAVVGPGQAFSSALQYAWDRDAIPVLVAGNDLLLPGSLVDVPAVIVAATDRDDRRASYSNGVGNVRWGVSAPGGEEDTAESCEAATPNGILSTFYQPPAGGRPGVSGYACVAGTSMAAPHVSGALAVLRSAGFDPQEAVDRLLATARDLGPRGPDTTFGAGRVDVAAALAGVTPTGQPISTADAGRSATTDVTATTSPSATTSSLPIGGEPGQSPARSTTTAPPSATGTPPPGATGGPDDGQPDTGGPPTAEEGDAEQAGRAFRPPGSEGVPIGTASAAVLAVVAVFTAHAWRYLSTASWARRTPPRR